MICDLFCIDLNFQRVTALKQSISDIIIMNFIKVLEKEKYCRCDLFPIKVNSKSLKYNEHFVLRNNHQIHEGVFFVFIFFFWSVHFICYQHKTWNLIYNLPACLFLIVSTISRSFTCSSHCLTGNTGVSRDITSHNNNISISDTKLNVSNNFEICKRVLFKWLSFHKAKGIALACNQNNSAT